MKKLRNKKGQFRRNRVVQFFPLFLLLGTIILSLYFKSTREIEQEFITPFPVRAYDQDITPTPTTTPETVILSPSPTSAPVKTEKTEILEYIVKVFGDDSADMITMIRKCENSTFDQNRGNDNRNGTRDEGVLQINSVHLSGKEFPVCKNAHDNWKSNIDCGKAIFDKYGLSAWSCSHVLNVKSFWE